MLIPDNIEEFKSNGEKILFLKFKNDISCDKMYVLHSVFTNYHLKNVSGELDFLVLSPGQGIFAIEVKHGRISRKEGTWFFEDRKGNVTKKTESPFAQVTGTMHSVRQFVLERVKHKKTIYDKLSRILWGTGIAFTSMEEGYVLGPEAHTWQILDKDGLKLPIGYFITALSKGWHSIYNTKPWYQVNLSKPTLKDCELIIQILRGDFEIDYSEINRIIDQKKLIDEYTKEQFQLLDFVNYNDRCLFQGPAGTGKTLMAIEIAKREIEIGNRVGLFCYNRKLGKKIAEYVENLTTQNIFCGTLHSFMSKSVRKHVVPEDKEKYYNEDLPIEFLFQNEEFPELKKLDILIVDEAQDLITPYYLEVFNTILKGGLAKGRWICLGDFSNQAIYLNNPDQSLELIKEKANFTTLPPLRINCRNTKKIATHNTLLTGIEKPLFRSTAFMGDSIVSKFPANPSAEIESILRELDSLNIPLEKITLLSPKNIDNTYLNTSSYVQRLLSEGLHFSTIQAFKGLENDIIILFDFKELETEEMQRLLYIGISRSRQKLYMVLQPSLKLAYDGLLAKNIQKMNDYGN